MHKVEGKIKSINKEVDDFLDFLKVNLANNTIKHAGVCWMTDENVEFTPLTDSHYFILGALMDQCKLMFPD